MRTPGATLLLAVALLALQQVDVPYIASMGSQSAQASLVHLHVGLLLAVALLCRDRKQLAVLMAINFVGWFIRGWIFGYPARALFIAGPLGFVLHYLWLLVCARMTSGVLGDRGSIHKDDLARIAVVALLLFPLGWAIGSWLARLSLASTESLSSIIQVLFASHFGVAIITMPLLLAWTEWERRPVRTLHLRDWIAPGVLLVMLVAAAILATRISREFAVTDTSTPRLLITDFRFALFALLGWSALRMSPRTCMLVLAGTLFVLVWHIAGAAERNSTPLGFLNLAFLAFELAVIALAVQYFVLFERDTQNLAHQLRDDAKREPVTGLPNLKAMRRDLRASRAEGTTDALGVLLLDHTDDLVAGYGLDIQARVAKKVSNALAPLCRPYLINTGQFALLPLAHSDAYQTDWARVVELVSELEIDSEGHRFGLTPHLGVAHWEDASREALDKALVMASQLAFEARRNDEMRPLHDTEQLSAASREMREQLQYASEALSCLRKGRITLHFQVIRALDPQHAWAGAPAISYGEVLCRLYAADGAVLMPDTFVAAIETMGRSAELDIAVIEALFSQLRAHPRAASQIRCIAVNVCGRSLESNGFRHRLNALLDDAPIPMPALCFEVSERRVNISERRAREFLHDLRARGCRIAIDDFGQGVQSFARLKEFPVDIIKIDGSFIRNVLDQGRDRALVQASVAIAEAFGAETVAEYVDSEAIADCLRQIGVGWMQGYLNGPTRPMLQMLEDAERR